MLTNVQSASLQLQNEAFQKDANLDATEGLLSHKWPPPLHDDHASMVELTLRFYLAQLAGQRTQWLYSHKYQ